MAYPAVVEVLTEATSSPRGFKARGGGDIGGESEIIRRPLVGRLACGVAVGVSVRQILLMVVVCGVGA